MSQTVRYVTLVVHDYHEAMGFVTQALAFQLLRTAPPETFSVERKGECQYRRRGTWHVTASCSSVYP
jgi:hypothetical protein